MVAPSSAASFVPSMFVLVVCASPGQYGAPRTALRGLPAPLQGLVMEVRLRSHLSSMMEMLVLLVDRGHYYGWLAKLTNDD